MVIPANTQAEVLLDNQVLTMGYPQLLVSGGSGSKIKIRYQEALFQENGRKGNRDEWQGKIMKGNYDVYSVRGREPVCLGIFSAFLDFQNFVVSFSFSREAFSRRKKPPFRNL